MSLVKKSVFLIATLVTIYVIAFIAFFDVLSSPVRAEGDGWLGPVLRGDRHSIDIGKVFIYQGDQSYYRVFWPCCRLWLFSQGLS